VNLTTRHLKFKSEYLIFVRATSSLHIVPDDAWIELPPANAGLRYHGVDTNMSRLIAAHPRIGERFGALFLETMFGEGVLAYEERELVAGVTAAAQDCVY
jgi:hypothetical protein